MFYAVGTCIYNVFFHPLAKYPGPKSRAATNVPYLKGLWTGYHHRACHALHEKYGPVVRIAPNKLSYINPQAWKDIYAHKRTREQEMIKDPEWYVRNPDAPHIVNGNHEEHARYRRLYSPGFSLRSLRDQEPIIQGYVNMFIDGITRACENGEALVRNTRRSKGCGTTLSGFKAPNMPPSAERGDRSFAVYANFFDLLLGRHGAMV